MEINSVGFKRLKVRNIADLPTQSLQFEGLNLNGYIIYCKKVVIQENLWMFTEYKTLNNHNSIGNNGVGKSGEE